MPEAIHQLDDSRSVACRQEQSDKHKCDAKRRLEHQRSVGSVRQASSDQTTGTPTSATRARSDRVRSMSQQIDCTEAASIETWRDQRRAPQITWFDYLSKTIPSRLWALSRHCLDQPSMHSTAYQNCGWLHWARLCYVELYGRLKTGFTNTIQYLAVRREA